MGYICRECRGRHRFCLNIRRGEKMSDINKLIMKKIKDYPEEVQKIIVKSLELAEFNRETAVADQLDGFLRELAQ